MRAVLDRIVPLYYRRPTPGLPPHVRSASALRHWNSRRVIVQDDVHALALLDADGNVEPLLLPAAADGVLLFDEAHGNKRAKLDLEAALCLPDGRFLALGSGATPARERIVLVSPDHEARILDAAPLYAALRAVPQFAGGELNIEGALLVGGTIKLFQRGSSARNTQAHAPNTIGDLSLESFLAWLDRGGEAPVLLSCVQFDLGEVRDVRFGFTDAALLAGGRLAFLACAEDSSDAVHDGPVLGCRFGVIDGDEITVADIVDATGELITLKLEGIESRPGEIGRFDVVADQDLPEAAALLGQLTVFDWDLT
jgi:hypothetical protein